LESKIIFAFDLMALKKTLTAALIRSIHPQFFFSVLNLEARCAFSLHKLKHGSRASPAVYGAVLQRTNKTDQVFFLPL